MLYGMHPGWIEVISGVMFSGKSEELIRRMLQRLHEALPGVRSKRSTLS